MGNVWKARDLRLQRAVAEVVSVALLAAYVGDRDLALDALEILTRPGSGSATYQNVWYPLLADARKDPRFKAIVRDIGWARDGAMERLLPSARRRRFRVLLTAVGSCRDRRVLTLTPIATERGST